MEFLPPNLSIPLENQRAESAQDVSVIRTTKQLKIVALPRCKSQFTTKVAIVQVPQ